MQINGLPVYRWDINMNKDEEGISVMSIVDDPAVEKNFMKFSKQKQKIKYAIDNDKQIITGVAIRADYPIYRHEGGEEFYTVFDANVIEKLVHKFMRESRNCSVNINHDEDAKGLYLFESFIMKEKHKEIYPEFKDIAPGSWIVSYKVEDKNVWEDIKAGRLNGFSIEVYGQLMPYRKQSKIGKMVDLYNTLIKLDV
ncbi:MAG: XkdF-like putative serine protease domain-containing protein [Tannerellaceae bacterium]|nr:XkdF-like putative serine protease domain-containing protein [Tannerellaceae bacterium]